MGDTGSEPVPAGLSNHRAVSVTHSCFSAWYSLTRLSLGRAWWIQPGGPRAPDSLRQPSGCHLHRLLKYQVGGQELSLGRDQQ